MKLNFWAKIKELKNEIKYLEEQCENKSNLIKKMAQKNQDLMDELKNSKSNLFAIDNYILLLSDIKKVLFVDNYYKNDYHMELRLKNKTEKGYETLIISFVDSFTLRAVQTEFINNFGIFWLKTNEDIVIKKPPKEIKKINKVLKNEK